MPNKDSLKVQAVTINQAREILKRNIPHQNNTLLVGQPGIGKTDIVKQVCDELGYDLIVSHPVVEDPTDYKGMPFVFKKKGESDPMADFVPFGNLRRLIEADSPTVFFFDDLGQASPTVQAAAMQLLLAREINGHPVSDQVSFVAATNRKTDKAGVTGILEPVKSRFRTIVDVVFDKHSFSQWWKEQGYDQFVLMFAEYYEDQTNAFSDWKPDPEIANQPTPRTMAYIGEMIKTKVIDIEDLFKPNTNTISHIMVAGAIGSSAALKMFTFMDVKGLKKISEIVTNPDTNIDMDSAGIRMLIGALAFKTRENSDNLGNIIKFVQRLNPEEQMFWVETVKSMWPEIEKRKEYTKWKRENAYIFDAADEYSEE